MNRSTIGLSCCAYATRTVSGGTVTFSDGVLLPGAVQADISITRDSVEKYGDNELLYSENYFRNGTLTLTQVAWPDEAYATLTGNEYDNGIIRSIKEPNAPYVGFGMIDNTLKEDSGSWTKSFTAVFLPKVKFTEGESLAQTRGESTSFSDPQLIGTIYADINGSWRETQTFDTYAAAETWLKTKMDI